METKIGDTFKLKQSHLNDEVPVAEQWIPVPSPSATIPISPSRNDGKKPVTTPIMFVSNGSDNTAPNTFMLQPAQELTPSGSKVRVLDKYNIGFSPVDIHGRVLQDLTKTGGWRAALFIFGTVDLLIWETLKGHTCNETAERMAFFGILVNLLFYLYYEMHISFPEASTLVTNVVGTSALTPLLGAFLADAYLGRFWTIGIFSMLYLLGLILLTLTAILPSLKPPSAGCLEIKLFLGLCKPPTRHQLAFLYGSLYTIALGAGGIRPCVSSFGADQFDVENPREQKQLAGFFNGFYFMVTVGVFLSLTLVVYISEYISWAWGFGTLAIAMALANIIFFLGTPYYRHRLPSGSPLTRLVQVVVASIRKWRVQTPEDKDKLHEVYDKESAILGSRKLRHTNTLRFLDRAAVETFHEKECADMVTPWRLCTVTQVEEMKSLVRVVPTWATTIILNTVFLQIVNFGALQAFTMDRRLMSIVVPAASVPVAAALFILFFLPFYDRVLVPLMRRYTGDPRGITFLQRIGVGLFISILAVIAAALIEKKRREVSWDTNTAQNPKATVPYAVWWLTIPFCLIGLGEVFASIGQLEFFYDQAPDGMRSVGTALFATTSALGAYLGSFLISATTKYAVRHGDIPWIYNIISDGHMDYYFWLLAILSGANFLAFLCFARMYEYKVDMKSSMRGSMVQALSSDSKVDEGQAKQVQEVKLNKLHLNRYSINTLPN